MPVRQDRSPTTGADLLCASLLANGIDVCFANPGTSEMHFVAALDRNAEMRCVLGLQENVVTGAADGYWRMRDRPAATMLHLGPGAANGLANVHNARRAHAGMVNIIGDHPAFHLPYDAPLTSDIATLVAPMSNHVTTISTAADVAQDLVPSLQNAMRPEGGISMVILPADCSWGASEDREPVIAQFEPARPPEIDALERAAALLASDLRGAIILGHKALRRAPILAAHAIARARGVLLLAENSNARIERGGGVPYLPRIEYAPAAAVAQLAGLDYVILAGAQTPVAFFAYPDKPSLFLPEGTEIVKLAGLDADQPIALARLRDMLGLADTEDLAVISSPALPTVDEPLTPRSAVAIIAATLPDQTILCDEAITASGLLYEATGLAAGHDYLQLTGGAIGQAAPLSVGAAVACPDRKVLAVIGDGSAMYTFQALWTQAREKLDIVTVILENRSYAILHHELRNVGIDEAGDNATKMLDIDGPAIDFAGLAQSLGVSSSVAESTSAFADALVAAFSKPGPHLIVARMCAVW